jgi:hypothetical protein
LSLAQVLAFAGDQHDTDATLRQFAAILCGALLKVTMGRLKVFRTAAEFSCVFLVDGASRSFYVLEY